MTTRTLLGFAAAAAVLRLSSSPIIAASGPVAGINYSLPNFANSPLPTTNPDGTITGGLRKFVDSLPGLGPAAANNLGQYIPVAVPDATLYPGDDYYEIALVEYTERMHTDLPGLTRLRGYVQVETPNTLAALQAKGGTSEHYLLPNGKFALAKPHYLGPLILAQQGRPTRIKFYNLLPINEGGRLFIPVDTTIMGAGIGPDGVNSYSENRATLHLHGGFTPWISDGTPHQWTVPAGEITPWKKGVSTQYVPDMDNGLEPDGVMTFYYPNAQSGRLMFYHDHAFGITRLNVYAGEAAGYLVTDPEERKLTDGSTPAIAQMPEVPLVIQDKTFVPSNQQLSTTDPAWLDPQTWNNSSPPGPGSIWFPHVYMINQDPTDPTGANSMGRWDYGPWFWPPQDITQLKPLPAKSLVPESFLDTPVVNGTAYPYVNIEAKPYRLRVLNACNDRMLNLQLYVADPQGYAVNASGAKVTPGTGFGTEVAMVPARLDTPVNFPDSWKIATPGMIPDILDGREGGVPHPDYRGPAMIQLGNESGILPSPVVLSNTPVGYEQNKRNIVVLNVAEKTLLLGPAERADLIVDFSKFAGKTVILYNDAPAPVPAGDPRNDYYTGDLDNTWQGGAPTTLPGYGPNTRTLMQFRVSGTPASTPAPDDYNPAILAALQTALPKAFKASQEIPVVPQSAYNAVGYTYNGVPGGPAPDTWVNIAANTISFVPYGAPAGSPKVTIPLQPKCIQELFDENGRMNSTLGVEMPLTTMNVQTTIPYKYIDPTTETLSAGEVQLWKITHNGVDTHAVHFHLLDVQVINRVGWDGAIRPPDPNELGWKETVRMNPLEDIVVAMRARTPPTPVSWGPLPTSKRLMDVTAPAGTTMQFTGVDPNNLPITVVNQMTDYGWEYVWHCHLLGHEEDDMMRPLVLRPPPAPPSGPLGLTATVVGPPLSVDATWAAPASGTVTSYALQRGNGSSPAIFTDIAIINNPPLMFSDFSVLPGATYTYRVVVEPGGAMSSPVTVSTPTAPTTPQNLNAVVLPGTRNVALNWRAVTGNVTGLTLERATDSAFTVGLTTFALSTSVSNYIDTVVGNTTYYYHLMAYNAAAPSPFSPTASVTTPAVPGTPATPTLSTKGSNYAIITWGAGAPATQAGYYVWQSADGGITWKLATTAATTTLYRANGLTTGITYLFRVQTWNAFGVSPYSGTLRVTLP